MKFYREGAAEGGFEAGIEMALRGVLVEPDFLFRIERGSRRRRARRRPIASATSNWRRGCRSSSGAASPTTSCWTLADARQSCSAAGGARAPGAAHARRPALARRSSTNFAGQWLHLRNLDSVTPDLRLFPDFDDNLRQAFRRETELFFESIVREDRSVLDLLTRGLHVRQRAARQALRHPERLRQPLPPRDARRRQPSAAACSARAAS